MIFIVSSRVRRALHKLWIRTRPSATTVGNGGGICENAIYYHSDSGLSGPTIFSFWVDRVPDQNLVQVEQMFFLSPYKRYLITKGKQ